MAQVEFGVRFPNDRFDQAAVAEEAGFDSMWTGEHIFFHGPTVDAATTMAAWAAKTTRIKIGSAITLLPLRPPAISAKAFATVDLISNGRTIVGIGVGGEYPPEFAACGVPVNERGARTNEAIEVMRKIWTGESVSHAGRFWNFGPVQLKPPPVQPGGPPIWVSGRSEAAFRRAARLGDGFLPYLFALDRYRQATAQIDELTASFGRDPAAITKAVMIEVCVADTHEQAHRAAAAILSATYQQDFEKLVDRLCILGTPDQCADQIAGFVDAGASHFVIRAHPTPDLDWWGQLDTIAREVAPRFR